MIVEIEEEELAILKSKAEHYNNIAGGIAEFYTDGGIGKDVVSLDGVGLWIAEYFDWI